MKKAVVSGVSGGIAAFRMTQLTNNLIKKGYDMEIIMARNATEFITPLVSESLTEHNVMVSTFEKVMDRSIKHISIAHRVDIFVLIPAAANVITKVVHGLADDIPTTTSLVADYPKVICPAMSTGMYENPITQKNLEAAEALGYELVGPKVGYLAYGDTGRGKFADIIHIEECACRTLETTGLLRGKRMLVTAGPIRETLDPARLISDHSSEKIGYEITRAARNVGADVTLISGSVQLSVPRGVRVVQVVSAQDMFGTIQQECADCDIIIKAATVGGYRAQKAEENKIKKQGEFLEIAFVKNPDILAWLGERRVSNRIICGFVMETECLLGHTAEELNRKSCDMIVANNPYEQGAGFQGDTNVVTLLQKNHTETLDPVSKYEVSAKILTRLVTLSKEGGEA